MAASKKDPKEKPLEKMTVKELREVALQIPEISGVHGKNKAELLADIKEARGIKDTPKKSKDASVRDIKKKIRLLKTDRQDALQQKDKKRATIFRRRIARLKKKTRRVA